MTPPPLTRNSLILRLQNHTDADAWMEFVEIYEPVVFGMMTRSGLQSADAVEQTQEVMTAVAQAINKWEPDQQRGRFRTWLYRVSRNILIDFWKRNARTPVTGLETGIIESLNETPNPDEAFQSQFERQVLIVAAKRVQAEVHPKTWSAFWLSTVKQLPVAEIARELEMNQGTVYVARSRVMKKLQEAARSFLKSNQDDCGTR